MRAYFFGGFPESAAGLSLPTEQFITVSQHQYAAFNMETVAEWVDKRIISREDAYRYALDVDTSEAGRFIPEMWSDEVLQAARFGAVLTRLVDARSIYPTWGA